MMRPSDELGCVYLCKQPVDMRKSINGLAALVEGTLALNPFSEHLFIFANRRRDKLKILYWERSGFVLWYKRLEKERFPWPDRDREDVVSMTGRELNWLLDGLDFFRIRARGFGGGRSSAASPGRCRLRKLSPSITTW
jgi:transposase